MSASARCNDVISIAPIFVRLSRILHSNGTATAVLAVPVPPPLKSDPFTRFYSSPHNAAGVYRIEMALNSLHAVMLRDSSVAILNG